MHPYMIKKLMKDPFHFNILPQTMVADANCEHQHHVEDGSRTKARIPTNRPLSKYTTGFWVSNYQSLYCCTRRYIKLPLLLEVEL